MSSGSLPHRACCRDEGEYEGRYEGGYEFASARIERFKCLLELSAQRCQDWESM